MKKYTKNGEEDIKKINENDNLIIKGENFLVLKKILKKYKEKVKCIYIDPPYNTGKNTFGYKDNFNHKEWLKFMEERLKIAKKLLKKDGIIFVSLDENESHYCKVLMDKIFGRENFLREIIWLKKNYQNDAKFIQKNTESILVYTRNPNVGLYKEKKEIEKEIFFENEKYYYKGSKIETGGVGGTLNARCNLGNTIYYNPATKEIIAKQDYDIEIAKVSNVENEVYNDDKELINKGFVIIRPPKKHNKLGAWTWSLEKINNQKNELFINYNNGKYNIVKKIFIENIDTTKIIYNNNKMFYNIILEQPSSNIIEIDSKLGSKHLKNIFNEKVFLNPKPEQLIEKLLNISTKENDLVLDFFAGSGTTCSTAHKMNRQYIGIEEMDYIKNIIVERLKKVIQGEQEGISKNVDWKGGGSFVYYEI